MDLVSVKRFEKSQWRYLLDNILQRVGVAVCCFLALVHVVIFVQACRHGMELSDSGVYLLWIADPAAYEVTYLLFGYLYNPLFELTGGSIVFIRIFNVLTLLGLAYLVSAKIFLRIAQSISKQEAFLFAFPVSVTSLAAHRISPTPNYTTLAFAGILVAVLAVLLLDAKSSLGRTGAWALLGVGGWLTFMGKPNSAFLLGVVVLLYLMLSQREYIKGLLLSIAIAVGLMIGTACLISGSVQEFIVDLRLGVSAATVLGGGHSVGNAFWKLLSAFRFGQLPKTLFFLILVLSFSFTHLSFSKRLPAILAWTALFLCVVWNVLVARRIIPFYDSLGHFREVSINAIPFGAILAALVANGKRVFGKDKNKEYLLAGLFFILPHVEGFGATTLWWTAGMTMFFWAAGGLILFLSFAGRKEGNRAIASIVLLITAFGCASSAHILAYPYRQAMPVRKQNAVISVRGTGNKLLVDPLMRDYLSSLQALADAGGLENGGYVIDMTGRSPGTVFFLGAKSVGTAWLSSGYPGSDQYLITTLDRVDASILHKAWILDSPDSLFAHDLSLLKKYGIDVRRDYVEMGCARAPEFAGTPAYKHILYKPIN